MDKREILRRVEMFSGLSDSNLSLLANHCRSKVFAAKKLIFHEGAESEELCVIVAGAVEVFRTDSHGDEVMLAQRRSGEVIGEMALLDGQPRSASVRAIESCNTLLLPRVQFLHCLRSSSDLALEIMITLVRRLRESDAERTSILSVRERILILLVKQAESECDGDVPYRYSIRRPFSRTEIARQVRCSRETASRETSLLQREGLIKIEGRVIHLLRVKTLYQLAFGTDAD